MGAYGANYGANYSSALLGAAAPPPIPTATITKKLCN